MKTNWRKWVFDNIYLPICFALTVSSMILVALGDLNFWNVAGACVVVWFLNLMTWGFSNVNNTPK